MSRRARALLVSVGSVVLAIGVATAVHRRNEVTADDEVARALGLLEAPIESAPDVDRLQASTALAALERARALRPDHPRTEGLYHLAHAIVDLERGDLILAEGEATAARHRLGEAPDLLVVRAAIAFARTDAAGSRRLLEKALAAAPGHARARSLLADLDLAQHRAEPALRQLDRLLASHPRLATAHHRRGVALLSLGRLADAEAALRRAADLDGRTGAPWIDLGQLLRQRGRHEEAAAAFQKALQRDPQDAEAWLGRGLCRSALGQVEAATDFTRAAELAPNDAEPLLALGDHLLALGRGEEAVVTYRAAIEREAADAASWLKLGNALVRIGRERDAEPAFREAIQRAPGLGAAWNGLGAALVALERGAEAQPVLERAASLDPEDPNPLCVLALLHERAGHRASAVSAWRRALERSPEHAVARRRLAALGG